MGNLDWRRLGFIALIILILIGVVVMIGGGEVAPSVIVMSMIATTIAVATPLTLGALCGIYCERAGVVNIGIEGMMLASAFFGWFAAIYINILAIGITGFLNRQLFFETESIFGGQVPHAPGVLPRLHIPWLAGSPIASIFEQQPIAISAVVLVMITHFVMFYTRWGLRTRAVGEHPRAADTVGINVARMRYANVIIGGMIAGLGGAYTNGRGFIALAAMIFGNWAPFGAWASALVFGAAQAFQINLQFFREQIPAQWAFLQQSYIVGLVPYLLTMVILTGIIGKTTPPAADGVPYEK
jgi:simple sugar transport system permease protein